MLLTLPTLVAEMLPAGRLKFGWLKASDADAVNVKRNHNVRLKVLAIETFYPVVSN